MATEEIERLRQAALKNPALLVKLADALVADDRADEAVDVCHDGLATSPEDVPLRLALGRALSAAGRIEEAQAALLQAASHKLKTRAGARAPQPTRPRFATPEDTFPTASTLPMLDYGDEQPASAKRRSAAAAGAARAPAASLPTVEFAGDDTDPIEGAPLDLERVASSLFAGDDRTHVEVAPSVAPDEMTRAWDERRGRVFVWLWVLLLVAASAIGGDWLRRSRERARMLAQAIERGDQRALEATDEGDVDARDSYHSALRVEPYQRKYLAMVALGNARLAADQGEDSDAAGWAMMKRAEREARRRPVAPDARADRELRQARGLLALQRGEACPPIVEVSPAEGAVVPPGTTSPLVAAEDGEVVARCYLQRGDVQAARRVLGEAIRRDGENKSVRALLALGSLELGAGDLDAAQTAYGRVLALYPQHPRALVGRALVALERNERPVIVPPPVRLGPTSEAWFHLAAGMLALGKNVDEAQVTAELDLARKGIVHDGRLALLYGRARLMQGKVAEAEQAMRVAERLDPNDADVAVLDAEVALAKGYEDKVVSALAGGATTPRKLAVLGRAQCLVGRYREAAATLDAALARRPGDAVAITYRAIARAHLGDSAGAIRELEKASTSLSSSAPRYGLGLLAYERRDLLRARAELGRALEHNSESFRARALLGRVLRDLGKPKEALVELDRVAGEAPALASVHAARARLYLDLGRDREARTEARAVIDSGKASAEDTLVYAEANVRLGHVQEGERAVTDALDAGIPQARVAHLKLLLQSWRGPKEAAVAAKALEKERHGLAGDARLAIDNGDAWRRAGDYRKAGDALRAALYGDPLHANLGLGRLELAQNQRDEAEQSFAAALSAWERGPFGVDDQTEARVGLARAILQRDASSKEALALLESAAKDDAGAAEPHYWLARAYLGQSDQVHALAEALKATEIDDTYAEAFALTGDLSKAADREKARKAYKRYLELAPDGAQAKTIKRSLGSLK
jgi:Flp pilus assembly protein TadD